MALMQHKIAVHCDIRVHGYEIVHSFKQGFCFDFGFFTCLTHYTLVAVPCFVSDNVMFHRNMGWEWPLSAILLVQPAVPCPGRNLPGVVLSL